MKRALTILGSIAALLVAVFIVSAPLHVGYYREWNRLLREIRATPGIEAIDGWRNEDLTLEEMGFTIRSPRATLALFLSERGVRRARDEADGIAFSLGRSERDGNVIRPVNGYIRFDSPEWQQRGLPPVRTLGDVLTHFDAIGHSLLTQPPADTNETPGIYINVSRPLRGQNTSRPPPELVEGSLEKILSRWAPLFP